MEENEVKEEGEKGPTRKGGGGGGGGGGGVGDDNERENNEKEGRAGRMNINDLYGLGSRMLQYNHLMSLDPYNQIVEGNLERLLALVNALIERWCPETHTFHFLVGEYAVMLEDVAIILGLLMNGLLVTGPTLSSYEALEVECLQQFGVAPRKTDYKGSFIKLTWFRGLKDHLVLADDIYIQRYVKVPHNVIIWDHNVWRQVWDNGVLEVFVVAPWESTCLSHLYRALCRTSYVDCKEINGPLTLLLTWAWIRLLFLALIPGNPRLFPIANRWRNWERADRPYKFHFAYAISRIEPDVIPVDICQHSVIWSATVPLISFECVEWHASDKLRRQFGLTQGISHQEWELGEAHSEVLTGPKNQSGTHYSFWVMHWTNRYSHVLAELLMPLQHPLKIYMHWYRGTYGPHLHLSDLVFQENQKDNPVHNQENQHT
ncbi:hypothetical protein Ahy_B08g089840 [Arachis hypogaea]|uniref:Aminotransferase-like plant mobile domain-containing protein n=1 Tax=Arachis hypogaea TaxID=3818 RepID=A0A444XYZ0_ARAHY|nr:hypothetical protein Ahy_B08g089840 [Arachis hypogaea]